MSVSFSIAYRIAEIVISFLSSFYVLENSNPFFFSAGLIAVYLYFVFMTTSLWSESKETGGIALVLVTNL